MDGPRRPRDEILVRRLSRARDASAPAGLGAGSRGTSAKSDATNAVDCGRACGRVTRARPDRVDHREHRAILRVARPRDGTGASGEVRERARLVRGPSPTRIRGTLRRENPGVHRVGDLLTLFLESALKRSWPRYAEVDLEIADWKVLLRTLEAPETRQWILLSALSLIIITHRRSTHRRLER